MRKIISRLIYPLLNQTITIKNIEIFTIVNIYHLNLTTCNFKKDPESLKFLLGHPLFHSFLISSTNRMDIERSGLQLIRQSSQNLNNFLRHCKFDYELIFNSVPKLNAIYEQLTKKFTEFVMKSKYKILFNIARNPLETEFFKYVELLYNLNFIYFQKEKLSKDRFYISEISVYCLFYILTN